MKILVCMVWLVLACYYVSVTSAQLESADRRILALEQERAHEYHATRAGGMTVWLNGKAYVPLLMEDAR